MHLTGSNDGLRVMAHVQFAVDVGCVHFYRAQADDQSLGDLHLARTAEFQAHGAGMGHAVLDTGGEGFGPATSGMAGFMV